MTLATSTACNDISGTTDDLEHEHEHECVHECVHEHEHEHEKKKQSLLCDKHIYWTRTIMLCNIETLLFIIKVVILPTQLFVMIGGPLMVLFIWPMWACVHSVIFGCVFWARDEEVDPCLSTASQWLVLVTDHQGLPKYESPTLHSNPYWCSNGTINLSRERMSVVLAVWSGFDIILTLMSAIGSLVFVFITFTDADGSVAEGWLSSYVFLLISGVVCGISIILRIAIIVYCIRFRCRADTRKSYKDMNLEESNIVDVVVGPNEPLTLSQNKSRFYFFSFSCIILVTAIVFGSLTFHDFLRAQYYLPSSVGDTLHGDKSSAGCDPMDPLLCLLPFPSSHFLKPTSATVTGLSIDISSEMLPMLKKGERYDASFSHLHDGFSVSSMVVWYLSPAVNSEQFVSYNDINNSLSIDSSKTLLIDSQTMDLHPHFTEKDYLDYEKDKLSYMVPAKALRYNTTYIAVVKGLTDSEGKLLPPAETFNSYLYDYQNNISADSRQGKDNIRFSYYTLDIFPRLEGLGVNLSEVQLLWDFHTASQGSLMHNLAPLYNLTTSLVQERLGKDKLYDKVKTTSEKCTGTRYSTRMRKDYYTLQVPWYLDDHTRLINPLVGDIVHTSMDKKSNVPFASSAKLLIQIPCSVQQGIVPATALMEVGHGLFWDRSFAEMSSITEQANQHGWILWSMDWRGLTRHDVPQFLRLLLHDMSETSNSTISAMSQSMSDKLAGYLILQDILEVEYKTILKNSGVFEEGLTSSAPKYSLVPPQELRYASSTIQVPNMYLGMSLGAIMGAAWNAYAPIHLRSVLIAGGSLFTFILGRSDIFGLLKSFTDLQFYSRKDLRLGMQLIQIHLDICESSGWANSGRYRRELNPGQNSSSDEIPNILLQVGRGDSTVTDISGRILAANLNASILSPSVDPVSVLKSVEAPASNSSNNIFFQVLYAADLAVIPTRSESGESTNVHKCIIQRDEITSQYSRYINENRVIQPVCDLTSEENPKAVCVFEEAVNCGTGL